MPYYKHKNDEINKDNGSDIVYSNDVSIFFYPIVLMLVFLAIKAVSKIIQLIKDEDLNPELLSCVAASICFITAIYSYCMEKYEGLKKELEDQNSDNKNNNDKNKITLSDVNKCREFQTRSCIKQVAIYYSIYNKPDVESGMNSVKTSNKPIITPRLTIDL